jgi:hypothetical protein
VPHHTFVSLDELLAPRTLSQLARIAISTVRREPFTGGNTASGSHLLAIETNHGCGPRFVVKRVSREWDWIMRATDDRVGREALTWSSGLLDRLPPEVTHAIVACADDGDGWAILMRDVSGFLFPPHDPYLGASISAADDAAVLDGMAALHVAFWQEPEAVDPACGFCTPESRYRAFNPETGQREANTTDAYPRIIREGWELLPGLIDSGLAALVIELATDPRPLTAALARYPQTVVHGDVRPPNIGLARNGGVSPQLLLLDWQLVGPGAPGIDLTWYLYCSSYGRTTTPEAIIACYRERLACRLGLRFAGAWWEPQLALSLLGQMVRCGQDIAWAAQRHEDERARARACESLVWWSKQVAAATQWL